MEIAFVALIGLVATVVLSLLIGSLLYKRKIKKRQHEADEKSKLIIREGRTAGGKHQKRQDPRSQGETVEDEAGI